MASNVEDSRPRLSAQRRAAVLHFCAAVYGLACAFATYELWLTPAPAGQLPAVLTLAHYDSAAAYRFLAAVIGLPILSAIAFRPVARLLARDDTRAWARNGAAISLLFGMWSVAILRDLKITALVPLIGVGVCILMRRIDLHFTRRDIVLVPTFAAIYVAIVDLVPPNFHLFVGGAAAITFALRAGIVFIRQSAADALEPARCFALAPLALLLESHYLARDQRYAGWPAIVFVAVTVIAMRMFVRDSILTRRRIALAMMFVIYPLTTCGYSSAASELAAEGKPRANVFEDAHDVVPAIEMLRGEKPYREVIPAHGLIQDALVDYVALRTGPVTLGRVLRFRATLNMLIGVAVYALGAAATGSAEAGILTFFFGEMVSAASGSIRYFPSLAALAFMVAALRSRRPRLMIGAGAFAAIAALTSIDFGGYAMLTLLIASLRFENREGKLRALGFAMVGGLAISIPAFAWMAIGGWLVDFFRVTIFEMAALGPIYALDPFETPAELFMPFPEILGRIFNGIAVRYLIWFFALVAIAAGYGYGIRSRKRLSASVEAMLILAFWIVVCGISYSERHHVYFHWIVPPLLIAIAWRLLHARAPIARASAAAFVIVMILLAQPTGHVGIISWLRQIRGPIEPGWKEVGLPRAQGARFEPKDIAVIDVVYRYARDRFAPGDTFFDFTNRGLLYFLLQRDLPIRQVEVAFYEPELLQREVIARLQADPRVRAAIVPRAPNDETAIDEVPNSVRAPLVWRYLQEHFEPDVEEGGVVIWRRKR